MTPRYVVELSEGSRVDASFALRSKELRAARNGDAFLTLQLSDRTGSLPGVYFRPSTSAVAVPVGTIVRVTGTVTVFKGVKRLSVDGMLPAEAWDPTDFLPAGLRPIEELAGEFRALCSSLTDKSLKRLVKSVFSEDGFFDRFQQCPGAQSYHHAYAGGLIEHTLAVARICDEASGRYEGLARDVVVTAAVLHDIGKVDELQCDSGISYTDSGRLLGHVVLGVQRISRHAERVKTDPRLRMRVEHAVLSHHGELEWGSPKRPSTIEALVLHHADNLDAKVQGFSALLTGAVRADEQWTDASNLFRRPLYAPRALEDDREHITDEDEQLYRRTA